MSKRIFVATAFLILAGFGSQTAAGQLPISIPKIPRREKPKPQPAPAETVRPAPSAESRPAAQPQPNAPAAAAPAPAPAAGPAVVKTRVLMKPRTIRHYKGDTKVFSWLPMVDFRTEGSLPSGAHYYVEVMQPGGAPWVKIKCDLDQNGEGYECGSVHDPEDKATLATGHIPFAIKMRNELAGTDATLFTGKAKIETVPSDDYAPAAPRKLAYVADMDWNLPIGHVYIDNEDNLNVRFWVRGEANYINAHVFYRGKEIGVNSYTGATSSCSSDIDYQTNVFVAGTVPQGAKWRRVNCRMLVYAKPIENAPDLHALSRNPGEYEVKVLRNRKLARVIKFTVGGDGKLVDNGAAASIGVARPNFVVVPVAILDDQDGQWDRNGWKTDAFYGHPLTGFTWPPQ
jgi:hypothetical protein